MFTLSFSNIKFREGGIIFQDVEEGYVAWACSNLHGEASSILARCFKCLPNLIILWKQLDSSSLVL